MKSKGLASVYAERFFQEYPNPHIEERVKSFVHTDSVGGKHKLFNGEWMFGPSQIWPAQQDGFALGVSERHGDKDFNYQTLKQIILLEKPELVTRGYTSPEEYKATMEFMFNAAIFGLKNSKLRAAIQRATEKVVEETPRIKRVFSTREGLETRAREKVLKNPQLSVRISAFKESVPGYLEGIRCWGLG